jgi:hypothetical protein
MAVSSTGRGTKLDAPSEASTLAPAESRLGTMISSKPYSASVGFAVYWQFVEAPTERSKSRWLRTPATTLTFCTKSTDRSFAWLGSLRHCSLR